MFKFLMRNNIVPAAVLQKQSNEKIEKAMAKGALEFIRWCNTGSSKESAVPPIKWGVLRGSTSVFVGKKLVTVWKQRTKNGGKEVPEPLTEYDGKDNVITIVYNTTYAAKVHEAENIQYSERSLNAGAEKKWLEKHLFADKNDLYQLIGRFMSEAL